MYDVHCLFNFPKHWKLSENYVSSFVGNKLKIIVLTQTESSPKEKDVHI